MSSYDPPSFPPEPVNPYAAPQAEVGGPLVELEGDLTEAEAIRTAHLGHEASIRSIGSLHYLGAFFGVLGVFGMVGFLITARGGGIHAPETIILIVYTAMSALNIALGLGLRRLQSWARWIETAFVGLGLAGSAVFVVFGLILGVYPLIVAYGLGLLIQGYILYLLLSPKASVIFSPEYRAIVEKTPYLKYRTSVLAKVILALLVILCTFAIISALLVGKS